MLAPIIDPSEVKSDPLIIGASNGPLQRSESDLDESDTVIKELALDENCILDDYPSGGGNNRTLRQDAGSEAIVRIIRPASPLLADSGSDLSTLAEGSAEHYCVDARDGEISNSIHMPIPEEISVAGSLAEEEESEEPMFSAALLVDEESSDPALPSPNMTARGTSVTALVANNSSQDERANIEQIVQNALQKMSVAAKVVEMVEDDNEQHCPRPIIRFRKATRRLFRKTKEG
jgi:hypothetical protein